jgi:rhodanese-related sulfurtransferase
MVEQLTPAEYVARRRSGELWQLVDVREQWEIETASIENAIHIPLRDLPSRAGEIDPSRPVALLCKSGGRSARAAEFLAAQGFSRVANIAGGIDAWSLTVDPTIPRY